MMKISYPLQHQPNVGVLRTLDAAFNAVREDLIARETESNGRLRGCITWFLTRFYSRKVIDNTTEFEIIYSFWFV